MIYYNNAPTQTIIANLGAAQSAQGVWNSLLTLPLNPESPKLWTRVNAVHELRHDHAELLLPLLDQVLRGRAAQAAVVAEVLVDHFLKPDGLSFRRNL